jgi:hypothetical protein
VSFAALPAIARSYIGIDSCKPLSSGHYGQDTVTDLAKDLGRSTFCPKAMAVSEASNCPASR